MIGALEYFSGRLTSHFTYVSSFRTFIPLSLIHQLLSSFQQNSTTVTAGTAAVVRVGVAVCVAVAILTLEASTAKATLHNTILWESCGLPRRWRSAVDRPSRKLSHNLANGWLWLGFDEEEASTALGAITVDVFDSNVLLVDAADGVSRFLGLRCCGEEGGGGHLERGEGKIRGPHFKGLVKD